jgi:taurine dioxygenase
VSPEPEDERFVPDNLFKLERIGPRLGVRVIDAISEDQFVRSAVDIANLVDRHKLVVFTGLNVSPRHLEMFAQGIGSIFVDPFLVSDTGIDGVMRIDRPADDVGSPFGTGWHADWTCFPQPPTFTVLNRKSGPLHGGTTSWIDMRLVFEFLSEGLQETLRGLSARHSAAGSYAPGGSYSKDNTRGGVRLRLSEEAFNYSVHPMVRRDGAGAESLYISAGYTTQIDGWTLEESKPLLQFLFDLCRWDEFCTRYQWRDRDLVIWDNRFTLHRAVNDYRGVRREMLRTTIRWNQDSYPT